MEVGQKPMIVSVPHTGTRFLKERLAIKDHIHTHTRCGTVLKRVKNRQLIAPLRAPADVWGSWCRRAGEKEPLMWAPSFFAAWFVMYALDLTFGVDFICIDKQEDARITDWSIVGAKEPKYARGKLHGVDLSVLFSIPFLQQHYPSMSAYDVVARDG